MLRFGRFFWPLGTGLFCPSGGSKIESGEINAPIPVFNNKCNRECYRIHNTRNEAQRLNLRGISTQTALTNPTESDNP